MAVDPNEVFISLGRPLSSVEELLRVNQWLADTRLIIEAKLGDLALLNQPILDFVTREAVAARMRNPEGYQSETIDDYTYRYGNATLRLAITDEWWQMLDPDAGGGAFSVRPGFVVDGSGVDPFPVSENVVNT